MEHNKFVPDWLTLNFLNKCLHSKKEFEKVEVISFTAEAAVPPGNNFGSNLHRVRVKYYEHDDQEERILSLIVKSPLSTGHLFFDDFYSSEPTFYYKFLPEAYKLINFKFAPDCFVSPIPSIIILEDLKPQGYVMANRSSQLDFEHCYMYVEAAATFHAMSFAVYKCNPKLIRSMSNEKMFSNDLKSVESTKKMIRYALNHLADSLLLLDVDKNLSKIVRNCSGTLWDMLVEMHKPNKIFNTLNQGDPWTSNMMFNKKFNSIKILDFQNLRYTSPVNDLTFFIWSSANHEVRENRLQDLCCTYLKSLNHCLSKINCSEVMSYETLKDHLLKSSPLALWTVALNLPLMLNPSPINLDLLYSKLELQYAPENNPYGHYYFKGFVESHLPRLVKQLKDTGVFDYLQNKSN